jgi:outer membrane cobalamin receptor
LKRILVLLLLSHLLYGEDIDALLDAYQKTNEKSLQKVDEKLGHVFIYSQDEIQKMQYHKLGEILKELPHVNFNQNRFGIPSLSLAGTKTTVSGFFRFFINDQEISSMHTQSPFLTWGDLPLDFIESVEIYYGDSSFSLGNETGIYFIRIYTKEAYKQSGTELIARLFSKGSNAQSLMHAQTLENGWSYFAFVNRESVNETRDYKTNPLRNDSKREYAYLDLSDERSSIQLGYAGVKKENYMGLALDVKSDAGGIEAEDIFVNVAHDFLDDRSLKTRISLSQYDRNYKELNQEGIGMLPLVAHPYDTTLQHFSEDLRFTKLNVYGAKTFQAEKNKFLVALNFSEKKYKVKSRRSNHIELAAQQFHSFDKESVYSLLLQEEYRYNDAVQLVANAKIDRYERSGFLKDSTESLFRAGVIYTPYKSFGIKSFYTHTYIPPTFYNIDFAQKQNIDLKSHKYRTFTLEGVYSNERSKLSIIYNHVRIDDFMYLTPVGFINIPHTVTTQGLTLGYEYLFSENYRLKFNYFANKLSEQANNSKEGGYIKFMGAYEDLSYFSSLIYRKGYAYDDPSKNIYVGVADAFDFSLGMRYNFSEDISLSIKGENLFEKATQSLYTYVAFPPPSSEHFSFYDYEKRVSLSLNWRF